ncbi:hypothetical protein [Methylobrevis pamukkalensis]|uniref:hypothetical protein n=1 Tax=Methylobrevis pamukkalensis TaxID=1439726 RepID=UPI00114D1D0F|nr:hypothetical protein [Methylobrevis pamukkalensis]
MIGHRLGHGERVDEGAASTRSSALPFFVIVSASASMRARSRPRSASSLSRASGDRRAAGSAATRPGTCQSIAAPSEDCTGSASRVAPPARAGLPAA